MKAPWSRSRRQGSDGAREDLESRALLISIRPRFANAILDGSKTIELRRTMPTLPPGAISIIYSSSPTKALVGWATVEEVVQATPNNLWAVHRGSTGVTPDEFREYFDGRSDAYGLQLTAVQRAESAISLTALRAHGLEPPQSWRYIATDLARTLRQEMSKSTTTRPDTESQLQRPTVMAG